MRPPADSLKQNVAACFREHPKLLEALKVARPYVLSYAENCPHDDGGAEAKADLEIIDAALAAVE